MIVGPDRISDLFEDSGGTFETTAENMLSLFFTLLYKLDQEGFFEVGISEADLINNFLNNGEDNEVHGHVIDLISQILFNSIIPNDIVVFLLLFFTLGFFHFGCKFMLARLLSKLYPFLPLLVLHLNVLLYYSVDIQRLLLPWSLLLLLLPWGKLLLLFLLFLKLLFYLGNLGYIEERRTVRFSVSLGIVLPLIHV